MIGLVRGDRKIFYIAVFMFVLLVGIPKSAQAFTWELPDRDKFSAGGAVNLEIAQQGSWIALDAEESWVKFFYDTTSGSPNIGVQLDNLHFQCDPGAGDNIDAQGDFMNCVDPIDGAGNGSVDYNFFYGDPGACSPPPSTSCGISPRPGAFRRVNSGEARPNTWTTVFQTPADGVPEAPIPTGIGAETKVIVYVQAIWRGDHPSNPEGRINSYRAAATTANGEASYWAGGVGYAVQNRVNQMPGEDSFFDFVFAPQCAAPPTQLASLIWDDADASSLGGAPTDGSAPGFSDNEISFDLYEGNPVDGSWVHLTHVNSGGSSNGYTTVPANDIGGNNADRQLQFTARNDRIYSWKWNNVNWDNGVQMTLPFDSYYRTKVCTPPPPPTPAGPTVSTTCQINGTTVFTVNWNPADDPSGTTTYYVDVGPDTAFVANNYWNKGPLALGTTSTSGPSGFNRWPQPPTISMPELVTGQNYYARIYYERPAGGVHSAITAPFTTACAPPQLACTSINPASIEAGSPPFTMTVGFNNAAFRTPLQGASVRIRIDVTYPSQAVSPNPLYGNSSTTTSYNPVNVPPPGSYTVSLIFSGGNTPGSPLTVNCPTNLSVYNRPYFRAFGGDVMAGGVATCGRWTPTPGTTGGILAFNNTGGQGAGTQLLAQALAAIDGFSSAQHRLASPLPDKGLSLANTGASQFGGAFGLGSCPPDFFTNRSPSAVGSIPLLNLPLLQVSGPYITSLPTITLPLANVVGTGKSITQYVDGDAYIAGDIMYETTTWTSIDQIPSYTLVVSGNIYISANVTRMDGIYIAQPRPDNSGGTIYTCSITPPAVPNALQIANLCTNPLTVNGAVLARTIKLLRSSGTARQANPADCPQSMSASGIFSCSGSSTASEQFIYTPEVWIRSNFLRRPTRPATYDVISNLPPIL